MNWVVETVLVGMFCAVLSLVVNQPFLLGITKHLVGYGAGLHSWFCQIRHAGTTAKVSWGQLGYESAFEGLGVMGMSMFFGRSMLAYFVIGCLLHAGSEMIGFNAEFLKRCLTP